MKSADLDERALVVVRHGLVLLEEGLELAGVLAALWAILRHVELRVRPLELLVAAGGETQSSRAQHVS